MTTPQQPGWYPDPLMPTVQERRWDGAEWTNDIREASVAVSAAPAPAVNEVRSRRERRRERQPQEIVETETEETPPSPSPSPPAPPARRATIALVLAIVILIGVAALQAAYLWGPLKDEPTVSSQRPVLISRAAERSAVDTAAQAAKAFTERSYETYDDQVDKAASMMTKDFAKEFRQTTDDAKQRFVDAQVKVTAEVAAQGVMTASDKQVEVLIFLNQFTTKKGEEAVFTPFRLKVTLIDTDQGWLVSDVDAT